MVVGLVTVLTGIQMIVTAPISLIISLIAIWGIFLIVLFKVKKRQKLLESLGYKMKYVKLGSTGLEVSKLCLGCMGFGEPSRGRELWSLDERHSREIIKRALDLLEINFLKSIKL
ncbi:MULTISPECIES: aldo/keto reductase [Clostridium]|uniref:aldo/keto reductase n=1 Tax=Clostridium pasteurianum TaxID=1501 RepID=UPI0008266751|nr:MULTISPECIES: aldo/keto reductase [Clostridium]